MPVKKFQDPLKMQVGQKAKNQPGTVLSTRVQSNPIQVLKASEMTRAEPESLPTATKEPRRYSREFLKEGWNQFSGRVIKWLLEGDRLESLMAESKIKDVAVFAGIGLDKTLLLEGSPTQIIGHAEQKKLDELLPALLNEVKRRGTTVELTERKAIVTLDSNEPGPSHS